jgi:hypothetical protein
MNWGYKILIVYLVFVAGILFLVFKASRESFDLVEKDYYEAELKYQDRIDENQRTGNLSEPVKVLVQDSRLLITFPKDFNGQTLEGEVHLYFPADAKKDLKQGFTAQQSTAVTIPAGNKGMHRLKLNWKANNQSYYYEETIFL